MSKKHEKGAVLLTTLLVMSLMAAVAVAMIDDISFGVKRAGNVQSEAQAAWYVKGAEDFTKTYVNTQLNDTHGPQLNAALMGGVPVVFPIAGGQISLNVRDGSQCLSLGALGGSLGRRQFSHLLIALDWPQIDAATLTSIVADWMDADSEALPNGAEDYVYMGKTPAYRTANTAFTSVSELRAVNEMTEEKFQTLRPFLCARPENDETLININTLSSAQAPLLAAMLGGTNTLQVATKILSERPAAGFVSVEQFLALPALEDIDLKDVSLDSLVFEPGYIFIEADIYYQQAHRSATFEYRLKDDKAELVMRRLGRENFRPQFTEPKL